MFTRPDEISDASVIAALRDGWQVDAVAVDYLTAGFGSHHWVAHAADQTRWFLTVDNLATKSFLGGSPSAAFDALRDAFATAHALQSCGLEWVVGPCVGTHDQLLSWLDPAFSIAVFPYVQGVAPAAYDRDSERAGVVDLLAELHQCTDQVATQARRETFALPNRTDLEAAIASVQNRWTGGPYAEPARALLAQHVNGVRACLADYDRHAQEALREPSGWTITHGEPHSANVLRTDRGLRLIDWDTALIAPPERDLWMLVPGAADPLARRYTAATGRTVEEPLIRLYALWWDLCEVGVYLATFRARHTDSEDSAEAWRSLQHFIRACERTPSGPPEWLRRSPTGATAGRTPRSLPTAAAGRRPATPHR